MSAFFVGFLVGGVLALRELRNGMGLEVNHDGFFLYVLGKGTEMMPAILVML